jgi:hypothetical protein
VSPDSARSQGEAAREAEEGKGVAHKGHFRPRREISSFGHERFHLIESDKALLHFSSIYLGHTVWVTGFIHTP